MLEFGITFTAPTGQEVRVVLDFALLLVSTLLVLGAQGWQGNPNNKGQSKTLMIASYVVDAVFCAKIFLPLLYMLWLTFVH